MEMKDFGLHDIVEMKKGIHAGRTPGKLSAWAPTSASNAKAASTALCCRGPSSTKK